MPDAVELTDLMQFGTQRAVDCLERAQQQQKVHAEKGHRDVTYEVGDKLFLNTKNVCARSAGTPNVVPRWAGPYKVLKRVGNAAYHLELPAELKWHPVFHVSLFHPWTETKRLQPPPPRLLLNGQQVWTDDRILDHRAGKHKNLKEFKIRWEGFEEANDSWEPEANIYDTETVQDHWDYVALCKKHTDQQAKQTV